MRRGSDEIMDTRKMTREVRIEYWKNVIGERATSGKTVVGFCKEYGINTKSYYYWQNQLRELAYTEASKLLAPKGFTEIELTKEPSKHRSFEVKDTGSIHINAMNLQVIADSEYPVCNLIELFKGMES